MILPQFDFRNATSIQEAVTLFREYDGNARYLSGGTDLVPRVRLRLEQPGAVIDLKPIDGLSGVTEQGDAIEIGALTRLSDLKHNHLIQEYAPALKQSLESTSCESLQMRGTLGGNLLQNTRCIFYNQSAFWRASKGFCLKMGGDRCNAVPGSKKCFANYCSDNATALHTLDAEIVLAGTAGRRHIPIGDLYTNQPDKPFEVQPEEILTTILIPKKKTSGGYEKLRLRGAIDYPLLGVAFSVVDGTGRIAVGAVGAKPHSSAVEELSDERINDAAQAAVKASHPAPNTVVKPEYRRNMIPILIHRLTRRVMEEAR